MDVSMLTKEVENERLPETELNEKRTHRTSLRHEKSNEYEKSLNKCILAQKIKLGVDINVHPDNAFVFRIPPCAHPPNHTLRTSKYMIIFWQFQQKGS